MKKLSYVLALPIATGLVWGFAVNVVYAQEKVVEVRAKATREVPVVKVQGVKTENITSTGRVVERKTDGRKTVAGIEVANDVSVVGVGSVGGITVTGREVKTTNNSSTYVPSEVATIVNARGANISGNVAEVRVVGVARGENVQVARNLTGTVVSGTEIASRNVARVIEGTGRSLNGVEVAGVKTVGVARSGIDVKGVRIGGSGIASSINQKAGLYISNEKIILLIDENTTKQELENYQERLKEKDIVLSINKLKFDNNKISYLEIAVNCKNGPSGTASGVPSAKDKIGFYRIYDKDAPSNFGIGFNLDPSN